MSRRRRIAKPCALCGKETDDWDYVCWRCREIYNKGLDYDRVEKSAPDGTVTLEITWYPQLYHFHGDANACRIRAGKPDPGAKIRSALLALIGAVEVGGGSKYHGQSATAIGLPEGHNRSEPLTRYLAHGDDTTETHLRTIFQAICDLLAQEYESGLRRGKSFVRDLADNKLSVEDLQRF